MQLLQSISISIKIIQAPLLAVLFKHSKLLRLDFYGKPFPTRTILPMLLVKLEMLFLTISYEVKKD